MLKLCFFATVVLVSDFFISATAADAPPPCPDVPAMKNFDTDKWLGEWNTLFVSNADDPIRGDVCVDHINFKGDKGVIVVTYIAVNKSANIEFRQNFTGAPIDGDPAKLSFKSPTNGADYTTTILDSDFDVYEIQVTCYAADQLGYIIEVNSKRAEIPTETVDDIKKKLADANLNNNIVAVDRTNCPPIIGGT